MSLSDTQNARAKRARRLRAGEQQRTAEREAFSSLSRAELMLPILRLIADGAQAPRDLYDAVSRIAGLDPSVRDQETNGHRLFDREVRWAMQDGKRQGWLFAEGRERWRVTEAGNEALGRVQPGVRIIVFRTELGRAVAAIAQEAAALIEPGSVQALFTSPLFPLCTPLKSYGTMEPGDWLHWMLDLMHRWLPLMRQDGTICVHLGSAVYFRGVPAISSYRERFVIGAVDQLGLHRQPDLYWEKPNRFPNLEWGAKRGMHPRPTVDPIYLFSPSAQPFMAAGSMRVDREVPARPGGAPGRRPSGLDIGKREFGKGLSTFPSALITAGSPGTERWRKRLSTEGLPAHPCPMPIAVPRFAIQMTTRPGDLVLDPFFGSGITGAAAEELGRRWVGIDHHRLLLEGAAVRPQFEHAAGYERMR